MNAGRWGLHVVLLLMFVSNIGGGQIPLTETPSPVFSVRLGATRFVFPEGTSNHAEVVARVTKALSTITELPGLPREVPSRLQLRISLVPERLRGVEAQAHARQSLIVLPSAGVMEWSQSKLRRVLRHEVAHVALAANAGIAELPRWFHEGYAEWAATGLTCEHVQRIRADMSLREAPGLNALEFHGQGAGLGYSYSVSAIGFLETRGLIESGELIRRIASHGFERALRESRLSHEELTGGWHRFLVRSLGDSALRRACDITR